MKIESIYEYIVLAHYLNYTTAAVNLHTSQPNLSKHIAEIEQELDVSLFQRKKQLELTAAGRVFLDDAIQIHHQYKDAIKKVHDIAAHEQEELIIQEPYIMNATSEILFKSVMRFKCKNPYIMTKYYGDYGKKSIELLEQGKIDIALTVDCKNIERINRICEKKGLYFFPIIQEPLKVWMHRDHPLVAKKTLVLDDLLGVTINMTSIRALDPMRFAVLDLFQKTLGVRPKLQTYSADTLNEFFMYTQDRNSVFLVSPGVADSSLLNIQHDMVSLPLQDDRVRLTSYCVFRVDYQKKAIDKFLETLEQVVATEITYNPEAVYLNDILLLDASDE